MVGPVQGGGGYGVLASMLSVNFEQFWFCEKDSLLLSDPLNTFSDMKTNFLFFCI